MVAWRNELRVAGIFNGWTRSGNESATLLIAGVSSHRQADDHQKWPGF